MEKAVHQAIDEVPTADVVPVVHTHWIQGEGDAYQYFDCSHCSETSVVGSGDVEDTGNYCKWQGAKMDEAVNEMPLTYEGNLPLVSRNLPENETLAQLAEEASELAQAALKVRRASRFINETPVSYEKAIDNLIEEIADVQVCIDAVTAADPRINTFEAQVKLTNIKKAKAERWRERLGINVRE